MEVPKATAERLNATLMKFEASMARFGISLSESQKQVEAIAPQLTIEHIKKFIKKRR